MNDSVGWHGRTRYGMSLEALRHCLRIVPSQALRALYDKLMEK